MLGKINYRKITIVVFITALIWVWVDLALDEELTIYNATITIAKTDPKLLVTLNEGTSVSIEEMAVKGPLRRISELGRKLEEQGALEFPFDATEEKMGEGGTFTLPLVPFLQKDKEIKRLDLKVESCIPEIIAVKIVELIKKSLTVNCFDENGIAVTAESIEPAKVDMYVPADWEGEKLTAKVQLTPREINQARLIAVEKTPSIELAAGQTREVSTAVKIKMPPTEDVLKDYTITTATLGFSLSENLQGRYKVEVANLSEVISPIAIKATPEARRAYENMGYQVLLEIDDDDVKAEETRRDVVYNFPKEFVRRDEIVLNQTPVQARFKLTPLSPEGL